MYIADTNVISASDPQKINSASQLKIDADAEIFLTTVSLAELEAGVRKLERGAAPRKAEDFRRWLSEVERRFAGRILPFDVAAAKIAGQIADQAAARGHAPGWADIQIAAIAAEKGFTVLTRNIRHFAPLGVAHRDPFANGAPA
jgi:predicted nucleic acid-binding protein